jgi:type IV pilus assembly protein PilO
MKPRFSKRNKLIFGVAALLLVLLIFYAQFFYLASIKNDLQTKQQTLQTEQNLLDISAQKKQTTTNSVEDTRELQKKIPAKPMEEQLILDLEKAENVSNSQIKSMSFSVGADVSTGNNQANGQNTNGQQNTATNQNGTTSQGTTSKTQTNQSTANQQYPAAATTGLKKLTVGLSVESPNYEKFETFIQTLESLQRIVVVESITYSGGQEITSLAQNSQPLDYSLTISAFYMPNLADLQAQLPKIDAPAPAGKENPLSQFSNITNP